MRIGSFCSGYGGLDLAAESFFDAETVWWSDIQPLCQQIMATHWPEATPIGDVTTVNPHDLAEVDVVTAGFPCQPYSQAGNRLGEKDERAIFQYIGDAIGILRPGVVFLENVAAITSLGGCSVIGTLASHGYDTRFGTLRASTIGAPHQRNRWFCVATNTDRITAGRDAGAFLGKEELHRRGEPNQSNRSSDGDGTTGGKEAATDTECGSVQRQRNTGKLASEERPAKQLRRDTSTGSDQEAATDTDGARRGEQRGAVPMGEKLVSPECGSGASWEETATTNTDSRAGTKRNEWTPSGHSTPSGGHVAGCGVQDGGPWGDYAPAIRQWEQVLGRAAPDPLVDGRLNHWLVEWMMGLPSGHVCSIAESRTAALRCLGNGVVPQQGYAALELLWSCGRYN